MRWLGLSLLLVLGLAAQATSRDSLSTQGLAARIDGQPVSLRLLQLLQASAAEPSATPPLSKVLASLIDNRLLGEHARAQYGDAALFPNTRVAFTREVALEQQLQALLRQRYRAELEASLAARGGLAQLVQVRRLPQADALLALLGQGERVQLDDSLSATQLARAQDWVLLDYRLPGSGAGQLRLAELWQAQNVQGRARLRAGDVDYLAQQAMQLLAGRYIVDWVVETGKLSPSELGALRQVLLDRDRRGALLQLLGLEADMHYDSAHLKALAASVSAAEIRRYYRQHRADFQQVTRVRARHIRCPDQACADQASARLARGEAFASVARQLSQSEDAVSGGQLGWLAVQPGQAAWLQQLAFALPSGQPSRPVRSPPGPDGRSDWEIVLVEARELGLQPLDSEGVRYQARQALAREKAAAQFQALRARLYRQADIELNPAALGFGRAELQGV